MPREKGFRVKLRAALVVSMLLLLALSTLFNLGFIKMPHASAQASWPTSWIQVDWDRNEDGPKDDWKDVQYAYYQYDGTYLYLNLQCYALPGSKWPAEAARYKWFIDLDGNMYYSGGNVFDAEYQLFVEDTNNDGIGEMYLIFDANNDNNFGEYEPWPIPNSNNYMITNPDVGGWRITAPNQIQMYIRWSSIGSPSSYWLFWSTDQDNPNLDQSPTTDRVDEAQPISVHNVAAISQIPSPTVVRQGDHVSIQVGVENKGTLMETFNVTCYFNDTVIGTQLVSNLAAGHQTTLTFDWDTSSIPTGNYSIRAWADSSAAVTESDENDNWCTSPATVTVQAASVHDVATISQVPDKTNIVNGTMVNINVTVSNLGDFIETFNVTSFYDSTPIGYQTVTNLASKTTTNLNFAWNTSGVASGIYYVRAMADSSRIIAEADENNNNCTSFEPVTIYSPTDMGRLSVDKVKTAVISGSDPPVVGFPTVYELTIIVANIGGSDVTNVIVNETVSSQATFVSAGTPSQGSITALPPPRIVWNVGSLTPGANATLTFRVSVTPSSLSLLYVNHKVDLISSGIDSRSGNAVSDIGDTDTTVTPIIRDVAATNQVPSSTIVSQGDTVTAYVTVKNFGNVSETFDVKAYYDGTPIGVMRVYNLAAGSQTTIPLGWDTTGILPGTYSIGAEADSTYEIAETNETNNMCTVPAAVKIEIHDIAIVSQTPIPTNVVKGGIVTVQVVVKNEGTEPESFTVSVYINESLLETKPVTNLQPNTTTTVSFFWNTSNVDPGTYYANTEASTVPGEKDTSDNACRSVSLITVTTSQYEVTFTHSGLDSSATGTVVMINGSAKTYAQLPYSVTVDGGTVFTYSYNNVSSSTTGKRFILTGITGPVSPLTVASPVTVTGNYETQYLLTVLTDPAGLNPTPTVSPLGEAASSNSWWYGASSSLSVTAQPVASYTFSNWDLNGISNTSGLNPISIFMDVPKIATAHYTITQVTTYALTVTTTTGGTTNPPPGTFIYTAGNIAQVTANANSGYRFAHWVLNGSNIGSINPMSIVMNHNYNLQAVFLEINILTITTSGGGTTIPLPGILTFDVPTDVAVEARSYSGYAFDHWVYDNENIGSANPVNVHVGSSHTLRAEFIERPGGGHSVSLYKPTLAPDLAAYFMLIAMFAAGISLTKRRRK